MDTIFSSDKVSLQIVWPFLRLACFLSDVFKEFPLLSSPSPLLFPHSFSSSALSFFSFLENIFLNSL